MTRPNRHECRQRAMALLEAEYNGSRDLAVNSLIVDAEPTELIAMLAASVSTSGILLEQLAVYSGIPTDELLASLRIAITTQEEEPNHE